MSAVAPSVTVVIRSHERLKYVKEAVASVWAQTLCDWELVVVDDFSQDGAREWLQVVREPRTRLVLHSANLGGTAASNTGLANATADLVLFLDDDDRITPVTLEVLTRALKTHPRAIASVGAVSWFRDDQAPSRLHHPTRLMERLVWEDLLADWWAVSGQVLYRTAILRELGGYRYPARAEDRVMWLSIARRGPVVLVPDDTLEYRVHPGQPKLPNMLEVRDRINAEFVATLPPKERARAERIRVSTQWMRHAETEYAGKNYRAALGSYSRAAWAAPFLLRSPLVGPPILRGILRSVRRTVTGGR